MREKYIEEKFPRYFVFGEHKDGRVDVASDHVETLCTVSVLDAERIINDRDKLMDAFVELVQAFDSANHEAFQKFWYAQLDKPIGD